jgi:hypothetical protein
MWGVILIKSFRGENEKMVLTWCLQIEAASELSTFGVQTCIKYHEYKVKIRNAR